MPVPFSSIGFHCPGLLPPSNQTARVLDNTQQIHRFYHRYCQAKPSSPSLAISPPRCTASLTYEEGLAFSRAVQRVVNNTHIHYAWCLLGLGLMLAALRSPLCAAATSLWRQQGPVKSLLVAGWLVAYGCSFTSYSLITRPGAYPLLLALLAALLLTPAVPPSTLAQLLLPALVSHLPTSPLVVLMALIVLIVLIALLPLGCGHRPLTASAALLLALSAALHFLQPQEEPAVLPAQLCFLLTLGLRHATPPLALASLSLLAVVLNGTTTAPVALALLLSCLALRRLPKDSPIPSLLALALALHFAYCTTPSFSFSSIRWAPAFVLTHSTHFLLQGVAVVVSILYPFVAITTVWKKDVLLLGQMIVVVLAAMSVLYNTSSPVVWSAYTPFLLFVCMIWVVLMICSDVCLHGYSLLWIYRVFLVSTLIHGTISRNRIRSFGRKGM